MSSIKSMFFLSHSEEDASQAKTMRTAIAAPTADSSNDEDSEEEESLGKVSTKMGKEIDRKSAGNIKRSKEEVKADLEAENEYGYTDSKWLIFHFLVLKTSISFLIGVMQEKLKNVTAAWETLYVCK